MINSRSVNCTMNLLCIFHNQCCVSILCFPKSEIIKLIAHKCIGLNTGKSLKLRHSASTIHSFDKITIIRKATICGVGEKIKHQSTVEKVKCNGEERTPTMTGGTWNKRKKMTVVIEKGTLAPGRTWLLGGNNKVWEAGLHCVLPPNHSPSLRGSLNRGI